MTAVIVCTGGPERPGSGWTRNPVRLPAERQRLGAISISHRERFGAIFARQVVPVRRAVRAYTTAGLANTGTALDHDAKPVRFKFLPAIKVAGHLSGIPLVHLRQQDCGGEAPVNHVDSSLLDAVQSHLHLNTGASACLTRGGSNPTRNRASV